MNNGTEIVARDTEVPGDGRTLDAYLAQPGGGPAPAGGWPGVVVIHEIWGLDDHIRDVARRFARQGYVALAPDLYTGEWREAMTPDRIMAGMQFLRQAPPEIQRDPAKMESRLAERSEDEQRGLRTLMRVMAPDQRERFAQDLHRVAATLRQRPDVDAARTASLGFCMGGGLSGRLATLDSELRAAVIFYGDHPPLDRIPALRAHMLGLYGGEDHRISDAVPAFAAAMQAAGKPFAQHVYPGAKHAFFNDTRPSYDANAAADAWQRVLAFFESTLA